MPAPLLNGVLPMRESVPFARIRYLEIVVLPVFTVNRYRPSWEISTQHGAVWPSGNGEPVIDFSFAFGLTEKADTDPLFVPPWAFET